VTVTPAGEARRREATVREKAFPVWTTPSLFMGRGGGSHLYSIWGVCTCTMVPLISFPLLLFRRVMVLHPYGVTRLMMGV
jgi:hypothetical protein